MSWLKAEAFLNILFMLPFFDTSQSPMS